MKLFYFSCYFKYFTFITLVYADQVRGQFARIHFSISPCRCQGLNSGCQAWWQVPLSALSWSYALYMLHEEIILTPLQSIIWIWTFTISALCHWIHYPLFPLCQWSPKGSQFFWLFSTLFSVYKSKCSFRGWECNFPFISF